MEPLFHVESKGVWYKYDSATDKWLLSGDKFGTSLIVAFSANIYRIDQCLDIYRENYIKDEQS